jgi:hypothetical protein
VIIVTSQKTIRRDERDREQASVAQKGKGMVARIVVYLYLVLLGIAFLMEQPPIGFAIGP